MSTPFMWIPREEQTILEHQLRQEDLKINILLTGINTGNYTWLNQQQQQGTNMQTEFLVSSS